MTAQLGGAHALSSISGFPVYLRLYFRIFCFRIFVVFSFYLYLTSFFFFYFHGVLQIKHFYPHLGRGRSLNFHFLTFGLYRFPKLHLSAAGPFEQLPQLLGHSNGRPRTSKRHLSMFRNFNAGGGD